MGNDFTIVKILVAVQKLGKQEGTAMFTATMDYDQNEISLVSLGIQAIPDVVKSALEECQKNEARSTGDNQGEVQVR